MLCCYPIGKILGFVVQKAIDHYIADFKEKYPIPNENGEADKKEVLEEGVMLDQGGIDEVIDQQFGEGGATQGMAA